MVRDSVTFLRRQYHAIQFHCTPFLPQMLPLYRALIYQTGRDRRNDILAVQGGGGGGLSPLEGAPDAAEDVPRHLGQITATGMSTLPH